MTTQDTEDTGTDIGHVVTLTIIAIFYISSGAYVLFGLIGFDRLYQLLLWLK